ncbi:MAG: alpha-mannosidase [Phycisphaerales bacterium]|nr:alpha-mannosidase [Phycisphaerales bacterium]MCB9854543.1 alpha-mannosidase [Phycisphaerales bacterium]MCB9863198.1 alpha-mannosidase [Phycisphaerales bacterium]
MKKISIICALISAAMISALVRAQEPTLYTVGYAHLDTQWRWTYKASIEQYLPATMHDNFSRFESYPDYIFNFSGANRYRMMKEYFPADFLQVQQYVASGRWYPAGSSMEECDVNVPSAESLIRQVLYGNHFFRQEFGKASAEFMLPDCFGFPASLPSILAHCGLKGFSTQKLTWGSAIGIPFNVGVWEGLDGSSVIAALNPGNYVSSINHDLSNDSGWLDRINATGSSSGVFADYMYYGVGDMGGAPGTSTIQWLETSVNGTGPVHVVSARADQMFRDIPPLLVGALPHYQGDMLLTQHSAGSITSQCYMKRWNHKNELLADAAERASVLAEWLGGPAYPRSRLNNAWTLVMGGQFHDILPGTSHPKAYEYSWNDEILAMNQFASVLDSAAGSIAAGLDTTAVGVPLVVYNPLSIDREDVVEATVSFPGSPPPAVRVVGPAGTVVPSQVVSAKGSTLKILFLASVPSVGVAVYDVQPAQTPMASSLVVTNSSLENSRYLVTLDANGDVASIYDKAAGRAVLSSPARLAFSRDYPNDWPAWNIDWNDAQQPPQAYVDGPTSVAIVENGAARIALEVTRDAQDSHFVQTIRLAAGDGGNRVEFDNTIDWRGSASNLKAVFPLSVSNPNATYNWEVGTIQRGNNDASKYEVPSHQWFDLTSTDGMYGATVLSDSKYGSDKPDDATLRLTLIRTPGTYGGYQDQGTQDWGRHDFLYGLAGHAGSWRDGQTDWQAMRMSQPPIVFQTTSHAGPLGRTLSLLDVDDSRVRVMAVKKAEDSDEIIVRVVELDGQPAADVHISMPTGIASARECDGQEQPVGPATVSNGALVVDLNGYQLRTFALTPGPAPTTVPAVDFQSVALPFNAAVTSNDGQSAASGFDDAGNCIPAEMLAEEVDYRGVTFELGPTMGGQLNAVMCDGQQIALPAGDFNQVYLLAAAANGERTATFLVDDDPIELEIQDWGGYVGQWDNRIWEGAISEVAYSWPWAYLGLEPAFIRPDPVAWFSSHRHTPGGGNEVYGYCYLFGYRIDLPPDAATLTLPTDEHVMVLAAIVANDLTVGTFPAQPLLDELKRDIVVRPVMTPIAATGWNRDVVVERSAAAPFDDDSQSFDVPNSYAYYEAGLSGSSKGLPVGGEFVSLSDGTTRVQLQPYDAPNTLFMDNTQTGGVLVFAPEAQRPYDLLAIFAASGNAASDSTGPVTITFTDGTTADGLTYKGYDWFFVISSNGINDLGRVRVSNGSFEDGSSGNPRIYQTTLDLATMGLNVKPIESLTFGRADGSSSSRTTGIFAVSGAASPIAIDLNCDDHASIDDLIPFVLALTDPSAYQLGYPDCDAARADVNGDGLSNGMDIQSFVDALLQP